MNLRFSYTLTSTVERIELVDALPTDERGCGAAGARRMGQLIAPLIDDDPIPDQSAHPPGRD